MGEVLKFERSAARKARERFCREVETEAQIIARLFYESTLGFVDTAPSETNPQGEP